MIPRTAATLAAAASALAASLALGDGSFFVSQAKLAPLRTFGRRGEILRIGSGDERLDRVLFLAIDPEGRILAAGVREVDGADDAEPAVARFLPDGEPDASFGRDGVVLLGLRGRPEGFATDGLGRPVLVGSFRASDAPDASPAGGAAIRLTAAGELDAAFAGGIVPIDDATEGADRAVAASPADGSVLVEVHRADGASGIVRVLPDGTLDASYGESGIARSPDVRSLAIDGQGRCVFALSDSVQRFGAAGIRDFAFGMDGVLVGPGGRNVTAECVSVDSAGRIVVFGSEAGGRTSVFRFLPSGAPDGLFCEGGVAHVAIGAPGNARPLDYSFAIPRGADGPYAFTSRLFFSRTPSDRESGYGNLVQSLDPADAAAVKSFVRRGTSVRGRRLRTFLPAVAVSNDGSTAYAAGHLDRKRPGAPKRTAPVLVAVDLTRSRPVPLPSLSVEWQEGLSVRFENGRPVLRATLTVSNSGRGGVADASVVFLLSDDAAAGETDLVIAERATGGIPRGAARQITFDGLVLPVGAPQIHGRRVLAVLDPDGLLPELDPADDLAVSEPIL